MHSETITIQSPPDTRRAAAFTVEVTWPRRFYVLRGASPTEVMPEKNRAIATKSSTFPAGGGDVSSAGEQCDHSQGIPMTSPRGRKTARPDCWTTHSYCRKIQGSVLVFCLYIYRNCVPAIDTSSSVLVTAWTSESFVEQRTINCERAKIQGQVYHQNGSLLPMPENAPKCLQIYFLCDEEIEVNLLIGGEQFEQRDIRIIRRNNTGQTIQDTHRSYNALLYSIIFWEGEDGYNFKRLNNVRRDQLYSHCMLLSWRVRFLVMFHSEKEMMDIISNINKEIQQKVLKKGGSTFAGIIKTAGVAHFHVTPRSACEVCGLGLPQVGEQNLAGRPHLLDRCSIYVLGSRTTLLERNWFSGDGSFFPQQETERMTQKHVRNSGRKFPSSENSLTLSEIQTPNIRRSASLMHRCLLGPEGNGKPPSLGRKPRFQQAFGLSIVLKQRVGTTNGMQFKWKFKLHSRQSRLCASHTPGEGSCGGPAQQQPTYGCKPPAVPSPTIHSRSNIGSFGQGVDDQETHPEGILTRGTACPWVEGLLVQAAIFHIRRRPCTTTSPLLGIRRTRRSRSEPVVGVLPVGCKVEL
ncbi:hypothetical protein PR048_016686, partial [Dryococelus australis]